MAIFNSFLYVYQRVASLVSERQWEVPCSQYVDARNIFDDWHDFTGVESKLTSSWSQRGMLKKIIPNPDNNGDLW
jgi:hypothetical protein